jgi:release factor glutamine methyltransferase
MPAARLLSESGLSRPEGRALLAAVLGLPIEALIAHPQRVVDDGAAKRFRDLAGRRAGGEPLAYLVGQKEFYGRRFSVSPAVLVPRPDTEVLVDVALAKLRNRSSTRVLDLGTGSGCIAITLAVECPSACVTAVERSAAALQVARGTADRLGARVRWLAGDWYEGLAGTFDVIVANPPYVAAADEHLADLQHEPRAALVSGADGLDDLKHIIAGARAHLAPAGTLLVEHGHDQAAAVRALFLTARFADITSHRDLAGIERVCSGRVD